jgi:hypothetical protein
MRGFVFATGVATFGFAYGALCYLAGIAGAGLVL